MNLPLFIARKYLFSRNKQHIINIISGIAAAGVAVATIALVVVLSVANGFEGLVKSYFSILDPDLKITAVEGKLFDPQWITDSVLQKVPEVAGYAEVIEENALIKYENRQYIATIKGVSDEFNRITGVDSLVFEGNFLLEHEGIPYAVPGKGVVLQLGIGLDFNNPLHLYVPKRGLKMNASLTNAMNYRFIYPSGVFELLEEVDASTVFVPIDFARDLMDAGDQVSAVEVKLAPGVSVKQTQEKIKTLTGGGFHVKNKYQQHDMLYKTMKSEKWVTYLILVFVLAVASFNILGSLSMLIIDKRDDILILRSMGATDALIRRIFLFEAWLISIAGAVAGLIIGLLICWIQIKFGVVPLPGTESFVVKAYPVAIKASDILLITAIVLGIGFLAAWYPVRFIGQNSKNQTNVV